MLTETPFRILLVDDDKVDRAIVNRSLKLSGLNYCLQESYDFSSAMKAFSVQEFDCVLLDYHMPGRGGIDVFRAMQETHHQMAAVIFLTGVNNENLALEVMQSGAVDYLNKDEVTPSLLRRAIRYAQARQEFNRELKNIGQRCSLTGLPNRSVFGDALSLAVAQGSRTGAITATLLLDLDHFKDINDTLGHPAGDELLQTVADILTRSTRETDVVIRLGGDEFVVIAPNLSDSHGAANLAEKIADALSEPLSIGGRDVSISTSIGIAVAPHDGNQSEKILKSADLALYKAKAEGRGNYCFFDKSMDDHAHLRQEIERDLRAALVDGDFELYYQPKLAAGSGTVTGIEALIRWNHPRRGTVSPGDFIPIAEASRLIVPIGEWVIRTACSQVVAWQKQGVPISNCSINLSPKQLSNRKIIGTIERAISETGMDPCCLEVEVTESALIEKVSKVADILQTLRDMGIVVSVDDFGTGYSSLSHLRQLPLDKLKIDRSFINGIADNADDASFTRCIINLGKSIGLEIVAEGVETLLQKELLSNFGCNELQGYYFSRPVSADQFHQSFGQAEYATRDARSGFNAKPESPHQ